MSTLAHLIIQEEEKDRWTWSAYAEGCDEDDEDDVETFGPFDSLKEAKQSIACSPYRGWSIYAIERCIDE